jgi:cation transport protein ChaC
MKNPPAFQLTRESILSGAHIRWARAVLGSGAQLMTHRERGEQIRAMLARAPARNRVWVFGYGSLIWNPAIRFVERRPALVRGWHRQFCLWTRAGRGSHALPGLVLGLEPGGSCHGVVYRLAPRSVLKELDVLWRREMIMRSYRPIWVRAITPHGTEPAIAFAVERRHDRYAGDLDQATMVRHLARASGPLGRCCDYLFDTVAHLRELGIRDRRLEALEHQVRAFCD